MPQAVQKFMPRDLCLVYAENDPRVSSIRIAEEAQPRKRGPRTDNINDFIERNRPELERYGPIPCRKVMVRRPQGGGRQADEYLLNEDQVTIVLMRLDTPEAADARFEIIQLIRAYRRGEIAKSEITIIAELFTPQRLAIERGDDNVVHVKHAQREEIEEPDEIDEVDECKRKRPNSELQQPDLFQVERDRALDDLTASFNADADMAFDEAWNDQEDGVAFRGTLRLRAGDPFVLALHRVGSIASKTYLPTELRVAYGNGKSVLFEIGDRIPLPIIRRAYARLPVGSSTSIGLATLEHYLAS
jgi:hypothetical protein